MIAASNPALPLVYLGPSLPLTRARSLLDADYRPPVKRGDLPARYDGTVVIVDGEFGQNLSVSPKEVLRLLDSGTRVIGAASMGALRAAELDTYGMQGCGWVYDAYASGRLDADDEVAVVYDPSDLTCLSVPLVNVRYWLLELVDQFKLDPLTARRLLGAAQTIFYADRTEERLLRRFSQIVEPERLRELLRASGGAITDIKAADAKQALELACKPYNVNQQEADDGDESAEREGHRDTRTSAA